MQVLFEMIVTIQVTHLMTLVMLKMLVTMEMTAISQVIRLKTTMLKNLVMRLMLVQTLTITDLLNL